MEVLGNIAIVILLANIVFFGVLVIRYVWDERKGKRE